MYQQVRKQALNKEEQLIGDFRDLLNKLFWLNKFKMEASLKNYKSSEIHCIEYIGANTAPNVTKLAESLYMTRGALTKTTKKLLKKGIIKSYQKPDNKKEVYFRLTLRGKIIHKVHKQLHQEFQARDKAVFAQLSREQFASMLRFAKKYNNHLDAEIKKLGVTLK
jgi:DNA-binding MarR family transcriptional regulator